VLVLKVDRAKGKISLGLKRIKPESVETVDVKDRSGRGCRGG